MPKIIVEIISRRSANIRFVAASGNSADGSFPPTPVSVTTPRIIPTQAAAAIKDTPLCAAFSIAFRIPEMPMRVFG